jgi:hypothetical protein
VVPDAGRRHGVRRPHVHRLLLHVSPPSSAICYCPVYLAIWRRIPCDLADQSFTCLVP